MDSELDKKLCKKYPKIFQDRKRSIFETPMGRGFSCGNGWYKILDELCSQLDLLRRTAKIHIVADQVKEKFGGLRFYFHISAPKKSQLWYDTVYDVVSKAENESRYVCEICGKPGELKSDSGWYSTLCEKHRKERKRAG